MQDNTSIDMPEVEVRESAMQIDKLVQFSLCEAKEYEVPA